LGLVISEMLAERGYRLVLLARDPAALGAAAEALQRSGTSVAAVSGDITDAAARDRVIAAAEAFGGLDLLVNNASELGGIEALATADIERFARTMRINVGAPLVLTQAAIPLLAERRGLIVNITSDAASGAYPGWGFYGASKAALELITKTLAAELRDRGVSAVAVDPGDMRTRMHQEAFAGEDISDRPLPAVTKPFWNWLFDQSPADVSGQRFAAQQEDARWLQPA
jgi:NAD(P)-dependent dehydrogenase (short-subunit alcohol dehydrogenase family)